VIKLFRAYTILAPIVGVLLAVCTFVIFPMGHFTANGTNVHRAGVNLQIMWAFHGWFYIGYVAVAFLIARKAKWSVQYSVLVLLAGLIPLLIFWVERGVGTRLKAQFPELVAGSISAS
jgi:integral membrane protein